jgi:hypothetical protein
MAGRPQQQRHRPAQAIRRRPAPRAPHAGQSRLQSWSRTPRPVGSVRIRHKLVAALEVGSSALIELLQPGSGPAELARDPRHRRQHVINGFINVSPQCHPVGCGLGQLHGQVRLANPGITMDVKQEQAALIIDVKSQVLRILNYLTLAPDKTTVLTAPDKVLQRPPLPAYPVSPARCSRPRQLPSLTLCSLARTPHSARLI